jgi:hypothetical protein
MTAVWHADPEVLARFAAAPAELDDPTASSLEAHLVACARCRAVVTAATDPSLVEQGWQGVADRIDRPRPTLAERVLGRFLPHHVARVVAATPALRLAWLAAVAAVTAAAVAAARQGGADTPFLLMAPVVPLAGVAVTFGPAPDPAGEVALASPLHGAGLVLWRTAAVMVTSLLVLLPGSLALPGMDLHDVGWVLPALALALAAVALSTWVAPFTATAVAAAGWALTLELAALGGGIESSLARGAVFGPPGQVAFAAVAVLAAAVLAVRHPRLSTLEVR